MTGKVYSKSYHFLYAQFNYQIIPQYWISNIYYDVSICTLSMNHITKLKMRCIEYPQSGFEWCFGCMYIRNTKSRKLKNKRALESFKQTNSVWFIPHWVTDPIWLIRFLSNLTELLFFNKALLRRLHSLQAMQKQQAAQRAAPGLTFPSSNDDSHETGNEQSAASKGDKERQDLSWKLIQQSMQRGSDRLNPFFWWFRSIKIKIGRLQFVIPSGKLMLFFSLFFWMSFLLRKRGGVFKRSVPFYF